MKYLASITLITAMKITTASSATQAPLDDEQITKFAKLALAGISREYPNKPS